MRMMEIDGHIMDHTLRVAQYVSPVSIIEKVVASPSCFLFFLNGSIYLDLKMSSTHIGRIK